MVKNYSSPTFQILETWQKDVLCSSGEVSLESKDKLQEDPGLWE